MKSVSGKKFCKILEANDRILKRINGNHYIYKKEGIDYLIVVPVHKNDELKEGLLKQLLRLAELKESDI